MLAEFPQRLDQARAQAVDVGAALGGRDQVDVAFLQQAAFGQPAHGPAHFRVGAFHGAVERFPRQALVIFQLGFQVVGEAVFVAPFFSFAGLVDGQADGQAGAQHGLGAQQVPQSLQRKVR